MTQVDLNQLRSQVLSDQQTNNGGNVYTDRDGNIFINPPSTQRRNLSSVPGKVFAAKAISFEIL